MSMNLNQSDLYSFEVERSAYQYTPPKGSDTFYAIDKGRIDLLTNDTFQLSIIEGTISTGYEFTVSSSLYSSLYVYEDTELQITRTLSVEDNGEFVVYGKLDILSGSNIKVANNSSVLLPIGSTVTVNQNTSISVSDNSSFQIFGNIYCHHTRVDDLYNNPNIYIDNSSVLYVTGLDDLGERPYSLTDYTVSLRSEQLTPHSQGEFDTEECKFGFNTVDVDYDTQYQLLDIFIMRGEAILGDFEYGVLGKPEVTSSSVQLINSLNVDENSMLVVSDSFHDSPYVHPTLYIGHIIDNYQSPGTLNVNGDLLISGASASVVLDRDGVMNVSESGTVTIDNDASLVISNTSDPVLHLDGTIIVHTLDQLVGFQASNIVLGEKSKIVVLNDTLPDNTILFSTPNGVHDTYLHTLFHNRLNHIQYHIPTTCGIKIDESMDEYRTMSNWFGGMRLEQAIKHGMIVWNDSYIELDCDIVPWANDTKDLFNIPKLFNTYPSISQKARLQELVDYISQFGITSISFRITKRGKLLRVLTLNLRFPEIKHVSYSSVEDTFTMDSNNIGKLFLRNKLSYLKKDDIISDQSDIYPITKKENGKINAKIHIDG